MGIYVWLFFALMAAIGAITMVFTRNLMYAALSLLVVLLSVAALYVLANAEFLAVTQILIYIGAVLVLLVLGIMLTPRMASQPPMVSSYQWAMGLFLSGSVLFFLSKIIAQANFTQLEQAPRPAPLQEIGTRLITEHLLTFEVAGILLLVALVGASALATYKSKATQSADFD